MFKLVRQCVRLVLFGPGKRGTCVAPPSASQRGATDTVEVWKDGLCVAISWQSAKFASHGSHVFRVSATRWFRDREGAWKNSANLQLEDLPHLSKMVEECVAKLAT